MSVTIKFRRGTLSEWTTNGSTVLASGEPAYETDTGRLKIGDGTTAWSGLSYSYVVPTGFVAGTGILLSLGPNGSSVTIGTSGLIANPGNNKLLTSRDSSSTGIDAENNATFDGTTLNINGKITVDDITLDNNIISSSGILVLNPNGSSAIQRDSNGNARGAYAIDLQTDRVFQSRIAEGDYSVIAGGYDNRAAADYSSIIGGYSNTIQSSATDSSILGGRNNYIDNYQNVFILGSNISATQSNTTFTENLIAQSGSFT